MAARKRRLGKLRLMRRKARPRRRPRIRILTLRVIRRRKRR